MIRFKPEVRILSFSDELVTLLRLAALWSARSRIDVEINSANDGTHSASSLHPWDLAWDLDTDGEDPHDLWDLYQTLKRWLPPGYDVVWEGTHVHVEWDTKRPDILLAPAPPGAHV